MLLPRFTPRALVSFSSYVTYVYTYIYALILHVLRRIYYLWLFLHCNADGQVTETNSCIFDVPTRSRNTNPLFLDLKMENYDLWLLKAPENNE